MADLLKICQDDAEHVFQMHLPLKFNFKNPRWRTADTLERPVLHHEIPRFFDLKIAALHHFGFLKLKFLIVTHFIETFCIMPNFVEVGHTSLDDRA